MKYISLSNRQNAKVGKIRKFKEFKLAYQNFLSSKREFKLNRTVASRI